MSIKDTASTWSTRLRLDSHHQIERFGVFFTVFALTGALLMASTIGSSVQASRNELSTTALYTESFTTSKTNLSGDVDGVYVSPARDKALVLMSFDEGAQISVDAEDYRAFLLGSTPELETNPVETPGVRGEFVSFGSTGYVGVLLHADERFDKQVLNLTVRANEELSFNPEAVTAAGLESADEAVEDETFAKYDQWRVFINPGGSEAETLQALDAPDFDPSLAFYEVVTKPLEADAREALDVKLGEMRADLARIENYTAALPTTQVDGLTLTQPEVPEGIADDAVTGQTAPEAGTGKVEDSTLALDTDTVFDGGFGFDWRAGNVFDGYLDDLVEPGESYVDFLAQTYESGVTDDTSSQLSDMTWVLSDGTSLSDDYASPEATMRPLVTLMNNLAQAYQDYYTHKREYQSDLLGDLLLLDVDLRDVRANATTYTDEDFLTVLY